MPCLLCVLRALSATAPSLMPAALHSVRMYVCAYICYISYYVIYTYITCLQRCIVTEVPRVSFWLLSRQLMAQLRAAIEAGSLAETVSAIRAAYSEG